jgi:methylmalonyl-CoA mutase cobalamin-binding domain/chain
MLTRTIETMPEDPRARGQAGTGRPRPRREGDRRALRDAGMEVIYTGLHQTPEMIVSAAIQEDVDVVALSILSGAHMTLFPRVRELLAEEGADHILITGGGIIPEEDMGAGGAGGSGASSAPAPHHRGGGVHPRLVRGARPRPRGRGSVTAGVEAPPAAESAGRAARSRGAAELEERLRQGGGPKRIERSTSRASSPRASGSPCCSTRVPAFRRSACSSPTTATTARRPRRAW